MSTLETREAQRKAANRRHHNCGKCSAKWAYERVLGKDIPGAQLRSDIFPELLYNSCGACGNLETVKPRKSR